MGRGTSRSTTTRVPRQVVVYERLREEIVAGRRTPDLPLVQEQLAEEFGVSRTPVRDALNRLDHEGLLTWLPGQGYVVRAMSESDVVDVHQAREGLELTALRAACGRHTRVDLARLDDLVDATAAVDGTDHAAVFELNRDFHLALVRPCGNEFLLGLLEQVWAHPASRPITSAYAATPDAIRVMTDEHARLVDAARAGDAEGLLALAAAHMRAGYGRILGDDEPLGAPVTAAAAAGGDRPPRAAAPPRTV